MTINSSAQKLSFNHLALHVHSLEKSDQFYKEVLQLKVIADPFNDKKHTWYKIGEHNQLHVIEGAAELTSHEKSNHFSFRVKSVEDFILRLNKYKIKYSNSNGESITPTIRPDGIKQIYFQDPDGYWIEVNDDKY